MKPSNVYLTQHAQKRLKQRLNCSERKMRQLAAKAWAKGKPDMPKRKSWLPYLSKHHGKNRTAKELMGFVFIFAKDKQGSITLITVV